MSQSVTNPTDRTASTARTSLPATADRPVLPTGTNA
jgi:hypothetical protein